MRGGALDDYGLDDRAAMATGRADPPLRNVYRLSSGCHALYRRAAGEVRLSALQAVYSAVAMGGSIAVMTVFAGFLYQHLHQGVFWVMALVALPALFVRPKAVSA